MPQDNLRRPSPRPPIISGANPSPSPRNPVANRASAVESWLDGVNSTIKPSPEELSQWKTDRKTRGGRAVYKTFVILRVLSAFLAVVVTALTAKIGLDLVPIYEMLELVPVLVVCPLVIAWNLAEFVTMAAFQGKGLPPRLNLWLDGCTVALLCIAASFLILKVIREGYNSGSMSARGNIEGLIASIAILLLLFIHAFLFCFYWCSGRSKEKQRKTLQPRIMYLPTGQPVIVTPTPVDVKRALSMPPPIELVQLETPQAQIDRPSHPARAATSNLPTAISPASPAGGTGDGFQEHFRQGVPPRKPVAGPSVGTHYASAWPGQDYQPDAAERARAARGEVQAQWMTLHGMGLRGDEKSALGPGGDGREVGGNLSTEKARRRLSV